MKLIIGLVGVAFLVLGVFQLSSLSNDSNLYRTQSGKIAPLLPEEFSANIYQNKFNHNGFGVNHTCFGSYYSSYNLQKLRVDCTAQGMISNNMSQPSPIGANIMFSLTDFTQVPPINMFLNWDNITSKPVCWKGAIQSIPPPKSTFLRDVMAVYTGNEYLPEYGNCDKWSFIQFGTSFTFYFDSNQNFIGFDFFSIDPSQGQVGVTTRFSYIQTGDVDMFDPSVFNMPLNCPVFSVPFQ